MSTKKCPNCKKELLRDAVFCKFCGHSLGDNKAPKKSQASLFLKIIIFLIILSGIIVLAFTFIPKEQKKETPKISNTSKVITKDISTIVASVVNVFCPFASEEMSLYSQGFMGSGTILTTDGIIITNAHVIPQDDFGLDTNEAGCFVSLPDPSTGLESEIYYASPFVIEEISNEYDLAFLMIYDVYKDINEVAYGTYPKDFPYFDDTDVCSGEDLKLGESIRVLGYPASTGTSLIITQGILSGFDEYGWIITSAQIDSGNSGGLAVDKDGCRLGIPTLIYQGVYENIGVILPDELVIEFIDEALVIIDEL